MTTGGHPHRVRWSFALAAACVALPAAAPTWNLQTSGTNASLRGASAVSDRVAWVSGERGTVRRTTDGGLTWESRPVRGATPFEFRDIDAFSDRVAYVLSIGPGEASRIFKTTDGGETWAEQFVNPQPTAFYDAMAFWDEQHGIAVSDSVNGEFVVIVTEDGGETWTRVPPDRFPPAQRSEGYFAASGTNVAVWGTDHAWLGTGAAARSRVLRTTDRGQTWQVADTPLASGPSAGIFSIAFRDALTGLVVGGDYRQERQAADNIAITRDGGATWTLLRGGDAAPSPLSGFRSVVAWRPGTETVLAVGPSGADISHDDGRTWTRIDGPGFHTFTFAPVPAEVGWAAGSVGRIGRLSGF
jgi:photosystem II stability/assembly factor-like uncharacterized protein